MAEPTTAVAMDEQGTGDALVLVHGVGASREVWRHVVGPLARDRRVVAVDLPGFGDSDPVGPGFDFDRVGDRVAGAVSDRLGEPFDLLGHSLGGAVSIALAARHPDLVRSLVLVAPAGFTPRGRRLGAALGLASAGFLAVRRGVGGPLVSSPAARRALLFGAVADGARLPTEDAQLMIEASGRASRVREAVETVVSEDLRPRLARVTAPVGLLWGDRDRIVGASASRLREARPDAPLEWIARTGHVPQLERPDEFLAALARVQARLAPITA